MKGNAMQFMKATKSQAKARAALIGVSGSGKTWDALTCATVLAGKNGRIALIDTENASASKYADIFEFDTLVLDSFTPRSYIAAIHAAEEAGYDVLVIDSLSHAWCGKDGVLALVDQATSRARSGNAFTSGWREVTPEHNALVDALVRCRCHLIVTMRSKQDYVIEEVNGKKIPRKIGLAPVQREGLEYEFDVVADIDLRHELVVTKSRCSDLADLVVMKPDDKPWKTLAAWLGKGEPVQDANGHAPPPQNQSRASQFLNEKPLPSKTDEQKVQELKEHFAMADDGMANDETFINIINEAFENGGWHSEDVGKVIADVCKKKKVSQLVKLSVEDRHAMHAAICDGKFDKWKKHVAA